MSAPTASARSPSKSRSSSPHKSRRRRHHRPAATVAREKFIAAAMTPSWPAPLVAESAPVTPNSRSPSRSPTSRNRSPRPSPPGQDGVPYPWETRITPPPPVVKAPVEPQSTDKDEKEAARRAAREKAAADKALEMARQKAEKAAAEAAARAAKAAEVQRRKAAAEAQDAEITEAGKLAIEEANASPSKDVEKLQQLKDAIEEKRVEFLAVVKDDEEHRGDLLSRKLSDAIIARGITTNALLKEWDKDGDGELSKIEFKQAVRLTLKLKASNDQIDEIFDMLDNDGDGTLSIEGEVRTAIRKIHEDGKKAQEKVRRATERAELCTKQLAALDECQAAAKKHEDLVKQANEIRWSAPLDVRLGMAVDKKLSTGGTQDEILKAWHADANGRCTRDDFRKFPLQLVSIGELSLSGTISEIKEELDKWFDQLMVTLGNGDDDRLSIPATLDLIRDKAAGQLEQEQKLGIDKQLEKSKSLQVAFAGEAARKDKEAEIYDRRQKEREQAAEAARTSHVQPYGSPSHPAASPSHASPGHA